MNQTQNAPRQKAEEEDTEEDLESGQNQQGGGQGGGNQRSQGGGGQGGGGRSVEMVRSKGVLSRIGKKERKGLRYAARVKAGFVATTRKAVMAAIAGGRSGHCRSSTCQSPGRPLGPGLDGSGNGKVPVARADSEGGGRLRAVDCGDKGESSRVTSGLASLTATGERDRIVADR